MFKKMLSLLLCALLLTPAIIVAHAEDSRTGTLRVLAFNVSGIPVIGDFQGSVFTTTNDRARRIGRLLNDTGADFIGTEEDFNANKHLAAQMTNYPYHSYSSGGLAQGQGLNVFSLHPLYNIQRVRWDREFGFVAGSNDALSNKGFVYALMELEPGLYVHMINVHMDAGYDPLSVRARVSNFRQLAAFINEELNDGRALIVQGDFNYKFKRLVKDDLYGNLLEPTGLRDVWAEVCNGGLYDTGDPAFDLDSPGDDLDRVVFRSGDDLTLTPVSKTVPSITGENGETYSDHDPMLTEFTYTPTGKTLPAPQTLELPQPVDEKMLALREIGWIVLRVFQAVIGLVELPYLIGQAIELLINGKKP